MDVAAALDPRLMCATSGKHCSKTSTLFDTIDSSLKKEGLDRDNIVSVELDNTNSNIGNKNSVKSKVLEKNPQCFIVGCNCHLNHVAAGKEGYAYSNVSGFDHEEHQVDLYYFIKGSSRRKGTLTEFLYFTGLKWENFFRYVKTRCLSLKQCCMKEIRKCPALKSMLLSRVEKKIIDRGNFDQTDASGRKHSTKFKRLKYAYEDPSTEVHMSFCASALLILTNYNLFLQGDDPLVHKVYPVTNELIRKLAMRFMLPECYQRQRQVTIDMLEYEGNYLPLNEVFVGFNTKQMLKKFFNDGSID